MEQPTSRYGRVCKITRRLQDAIKHRALTSILALQEDMEPETDHIDPVAMLATTNKDTMCCHQAMQ